MIAGGTDLVIALRKGDLTPSCLIDITQIPELRRIEEEDGRISIGAAVTHSELASSPLLRRYAKVLSDAAGKVGSPQIRNVGTIGGNIVNASPAADTLPPLMVLNAVAHVISKEEEARFPLHQLFRGPYETKLKSHEILVKVSFPKLSPEKRTSFVRLARREGMAISRMSVAVVLEKEDAKELLKEIRISVGSVTPTPQRIKEAEVLLEGMVPDEGRLKQAAKKVSEVMIQHSGIRPSTSYKAPVIEGLFLRAVREALEQKE